MRKVLSLVLVLVLVLGGVPFGFAEVTEDMTAGEKLRELDLLQGDETGDLMEDKMFTRAEMMVVLARFNKVDDEAKDFSITTSFNDVTGHWAEGYIEYGYLEGWTKGVGGGMFDPEGMMTEQMVAMFMMRLLNYEADWETVIEDAAALGIINDVKSLQFTRADAFDMMWDTLMTPKRGSDVPFGIEMGFMEPMVEEVDIDEATAINEKVVEVFLNEDIDAPENIDGSVFMVMDEDEEYLDVAKAEFAGWDSDNYTVLVWLDDELEAGGLYSIISGDSVADFGGKKADASEPTVKSIKATDYNEVVIEFNEPIVLSTLKAEIAEKYGDKDDLAILDMEYDSRTKILLTTEEQLGATLYEIDITDAEDFAGNVMEDETQTFVGQEMPDDDLAVVGAKSNDYDEVSVRFNVRINPDTIDPVNFEIAEKYGDKDELVVLDAWLAEDEDDYYGNSKIKDSTEDDYKKYVILRTEAQQDATLYELTVDNLETLYGYGLDSDKDTTTFVGQSIPDDELTFDVDSTSNTKVKVTFSENVNPETVDLSDFEIAKKYGDKDELAVLDFEIDADDEFVVTLTTESQSGATLYELEINDLEDEYGNELDSDENVQTFVGSEIADKIEKIEKITRDVDDQDTQIKVFFDQNIGDNATSVSYYFIDNSIGYPEDVDEAVEDNAVILTIGETTEGKLYKLTVQKGLENSDGIKTTEDLTKNFVGYGEAAELPGIEAVMALDNQTLKVYFDRDSDDDTIDGIIWDSNALMAGALEISDDDNDTPDYDIADYDHFVYQPDSEAAVLIIRIDPNDFDQPFAEDSVDNGSTFRLIADEDKVYSDDDANILEFAYNDDDPDEPYLEAAMMLNEGTVRLFFSEEVTFDADDIGFYNDEGMDSGDLVAVGGNNTTNDDVVFDIALDFDSSFDDDIAYVAFLDEHVTDLSGFIDSNDEGDDISGRTDLEFAVSTKELDPIDDVFAVMTNEQTIKVYYPEDMDETDVTNIDNYSFLDEDSSSPGTVYDGGYALFDRATYDDDTYTAVLYLKGPIATTIDFDEYYLAVQGDVENVFGNNTIDDEYDIDMEPWLVFEFADSTKSVPEPELLSAKVSDDRYTLTIKFNEDVYFTESDATGTDAFDDGTSLVAGLTKADFLDALNITVNFEGESEVRDIETADIYSIMAKAADDEDEVKVEFNVPLKANTSGTITTEDMDSTIKNRADVAALTDSDAVEITFGVAPSLYPTVVRPSILEVHVDNTTDADINVVSLKFSKAVDDSTVTTGDFSFDGDLTFVSASGANAGGGFTDVVDDEYLVFTIANYTSGTGVTEDFVYTAGDLDGVNGNSVLTQTVTATNIGDHADPMVVDTLAEFDGPVTSHDLDEDGEVDTIAIGFTEEMNKFSFNYSMFTSTDYDFLDQDPVAYEDDLSILLFSVESNNGPLGTGTVSSLDVAENAIADASSEGNGIVLYDDLTVVDMAAPLTTGVNTNNSDTLELEFSEDIDSIVSTTGEALGSTDITANVVTFEFDTSATTGDVFSFVVDDSVGNQSKQYNYTFNGTTWLAPMVMFLEVR